MNPDAYQEQVEILLRIFSQFPDISCLYDTRFLKIYFSLENDWEICIVYSHAFRSPVLYFRNRIQGLTLEEVHNHIKAYTEYISPAELPYTGEPYFFLHPCRSQNLLEGFSLATWLSVVLQVLGLSLPLGFYIEFNKFIGVNKSV
ncbi:hypothetical protein SteCoe_15057 [Stentor coeruleus]|uniref:Uncharacterized protein n=1 Tax=Stentor coeruleus TaxID=5963 RepID=A0A1R2C4F2_9CILI|nr:hypothetical protein SteCoe_15057 [Stentor coeruleus]